MDIIHTTVRGPLDLQKVLRQAMAHKLGTIGEMDLMQHLVAACAEAAEHTIVELRLLPEDMIDPGVAITLRLGKLSYRCPSCQYQRLRASYRFCPKCGERIYWKDAKSRS